MTDMVVPLVAVVISTRNRGASVVHTVESVLANDYTPFDVHVVDQSDNDRTETALRPFCKQPNFYYLKTVKRGLARGRNEGIAHAQGELVAFTDDDCQVSANWVQEVVHAFAVDSRIGVVFGNVLAGPHDPQQGFIPAYVRDTAFLAHTIREKHHVEGIGACMGVRRSVWQALHGFDESLGAGGRFRSAEEVDFAVRALLTGHKVYETPALHVLHYGFRNWERGHELIWAYWYGTGAMFAKHIKVGHWSVFALLLKLAWRWAFGGPIVDIGRKPSRLLRLGAFSSGFLAGMRSPVDRSRNHYADRG